MLRLKILDFEKKMNDSRIEKSKKSMCTSKGIDRLVINFTESTNKPHKQKQNQKNRG